MRELEARGHGVECFDLGVNPLADVRYPIDIGYVPGVVYHLAADKHAPSGEDHPFATQHVNIEGTRNALALGCRVILASTCKAAVPETVYGASKLIAERMVLNAHGVVGRLYNVRESNRNVFQAWDKQFEETSRIDVAPCTRYFITLADAVTFLADLLSIQSGRYAPNPGAPHHMVNVARKWCRDRDVDPDDTIRMVERRRGDRVVEPLHAPHETIRSVPGRSFNQITSPHDVHAEVLVA
jgi:FlaA1/EpsC-like NDP-sugar epimerase